MGQDGDHSRTWSPRAHPTRPKAAARGSGAEHGAGSPGGLGSMTEGVVEGEAGGEGQRHGEGLPLTWPGGFSGRAHRCTSNSEGSGSCGRSVRRPPAGKGRGAEATGSWGQGQEFRALEPWQLPCPRLAHPARRPRPRACAGTALRRERLAGQGAATRCVGCRPGCPGRA